MKKLAEKRDYYDSHRENSPLVQAVDAVSIDTTGMSIDEVVQAIINLVNDENSAKK